MVQNPQIARHDLVLQDGSSRDVNPVPVVGDDDDRPPETDSPPEGDVPRHSEVVQLQHVGDGAEPGEEGGDFLEVPPELDQGGGGEHPLGRHDQAALLEGVEVGHHHQQVAGLLHWQEPEEEKYYNIMSQ